MFKWKKSKKDPISKFNGLLGGSTDSTGAVARTHGPGGATSICTSIGGAGSAVVCRVTVPEGVQPGQEFPVYYAVNRIVRVRCPPGTAPGQSLQITFPIVDQVNNDPGGSQSSSSSQQQSPSTSSQNMMMNIMNSPNVERIAGDEEGAYVVTVPEGVRGGQQFPVTIQGQQIMVTVPTPHACVGMQLRVVPPPPPPHDQPMQPFEVQVPKGVLPGQPFALLAGGVRVFVVCPVHAAPGQHILFHLPLALLMTQKAKTPMEATTSCGRSRTIQKSQDCE